MSNGKQDDDVAGEVEEFSYFEMIGPSFVIFDVDKFREKTKALAVDYREDGLAILDEETMEWYYLPFTDRKKKKTTLTTIPPVQH